MRPPSSKEVLDRLGELVIKDVAEAGGISDTRPLTAHVIGEEEVRAFEDLILYPRAIFKSVAGDVFHVAADVSVNRDLCMPTTHADISLSLTRVDGEAL